MSNTLFIFMIVFIYALIYIKREKKELKTLEKYTSRYTMKKVLINKLRIIIVLGVLILIFKTIGVIADLFNF